MSLVLQIVVFFLAWLGVWWLIEGEISIIAALIGTAVAMGITRLINGKWGVF